MKRLTQAETKKELRETGIERSGASWVVYADPWKRVRYDFHRHSKHQLLYAFSGTLYLETKEGFWILPPERAAWIPAGTKHATTLNNATCYSVSFDPRWMRTAGKEVKIMAVTPLLREMISYAAEWKVKSGRRSDFTEKFFGVMARLCEEGKEMPYRLPRATTEAIARVVEWVVGNPAEADLAGAARVAKMSVRTFRRRFPEEMKMSWREYLHVVRMLKGMELLGTEMNVTEVALAVGFDSVSAFSKGFAAFTSENPLEYKKRVCGKMKNMSE
jgi:AraC-like DNA-binding protein